MGTSRRSCSSTACRFRFSTTTSRSQWLRSAATAGGIARARSPNWSATTCSGIGSDDRAPSASSGGNDKGKVEGLVKYARANFMTPIPVAPSYAALIAMLNDSCPSSGDLRHLAIAA